MTAKKKNDLIHDPEVHKLGKLAPKPQRLLIRRYLNMEAILPVAPPVVVNSANQSVPLAMYLNDREGDCTFAAIGNALRVVSKGAKQIADGDVQSGYVAVTGQEGAAYNPSSGANDNGCAELDVLDYWTKVGVPDGDKILGHAGLAMSNQDEVRAWLFVGGFVYLGIALATEQQNQEVWDFVPGSQPGSWGGHAVPLFDLDSQTGTGYVGTWGAYKKVTVPFLLNQADEGHAVITQEWVDANKSNPLINIPALVADLQALQKEL